MHNGKRSLIETNRWAWSRLAARVMRRDRWTCTVCGGEAQEVDHIIPRIAGGSDAMDNLRAICKRCHKWRVAESLGIRATNTGDYSRRDPSSSVVTGDYSRTPGRSVYSRKPR